MNLKIKLAYFSIALSILSFMGVLFGADIGTFIIFAIGCLTYSYVALYLFKKDGAEGSSKAFLGGLIAMTIFLVIHVFFLIMTLTFRESDTWKWGWQFMLTVFGIIPAVLVGIVIGGVADLFSGKKSDSNMPLPKKGNIFKTALIGGIIGIALGLVLAFPFASYQTRYLQTEVQTYRQVQGLRPVGVGELGEQYSYSFNLKHGLINFSLIFMLLGAFVGLVTGIVIDKKSNS